MPLLFSTKYVSKPRPAGLSMTTTLTFVRKRIREIVPNTVAAKPMRFGEIVETIFEELDGTAGKRFMPRRRILALVRAESNDRFPDGPPSLYAPEVEVEG